MLRSLKNMRGLTIAARDGTLGTVRDVLFDDENWTARWLVVDVGGLFEKTLVLVSPAHVRSIGDDAISVSLTKEELRHAPDIETDAPVSRLAERKYHDFYNIPYYWGGPFIWGGTPGPVAPIAEYATGNSGYASFSPEAREAASAMGNDAEPLLAAPESPDDATHTRSVRGTLGYSVAARDERFGSVDDFWAEDDSWTIRYLVIDTTRFWPGKPVLVSPEWVTSVSWATNDISIDLRKDEIKAAPTVDSLQRLSREDEERLHRHYGRMGYWMKAAGTPRRDFQEERGHRPT